MWKLTSPLLPLPSRDPGFPFSALQAPGEHRTSLVSPRLHLRLCSTFPYSAPIVSALFEFYLFKQRVIRSIFRSPAGTDFFPESLCRNRSHSTGFPNGKKMYSLCFQMCFFVSEEMFKYFWFIYESGPYHFFYSMWSEQNENAKGAAFTRKS